MSDPKPLKVITCLYNDGRAEQCGAIVEDTDNARRTHRAWHKNDKDVKDALRAGIRERDAKIAALELQVTDTQRDIDTIEIPAPVLPIEVNADGWTDDDEPDPTTDDQPASTYTEDNNANTIQLDNFTAPVATDGISGIYTPQRNMIG